MGIRVALFSAVKALIKITHLIIKPSGVITMIIRFIGCGFLAACLAVSGAQAADGESRFDGTWDTIISCGNDSDAYGYSFEFPSTVKDGELTGSKGEEGKPGWLQLKGKIEQDGSAKIYAHGLVGASQYAVGNRPKGSDYGYHIEAEFKGDEGTGRRIEGRPCDVEFKKQKS